LVFFSFSVGHSWVNVNPISTTSNKFGVSQYLV
jgi:hypothetical protein